MEQVKDYSDSRLYAGCVYCGMQVTTRDHVPSKAFLDAPYPENLPVVGACKDCNEGFSKDERYVACVIEVARRGSSEPLEMRRLTVAATLQRSPNLKALIDSGRSELNGRVQYGFDSNRLERVLVKLAKGHACYELAVWNLRAPSSVWWAPLVALSELERDQFDEPVLVNTIGEVGSIWNRSADAVFQSTEMK
ncbi:hypothetical protein [Stenotrophomonas maltophilia]|uniref:hypothetical protein n=1 Tax=Stenotrophomonas maltophilia TaxID=40324 RepID=UPI001072A232|nr:hypothetical protein [Stenotrophomonas maltophilia]